MIRRRRKKKSHRATVDLFPFLGIIVSVIGILVLLISGLVAAGALKKEAIDEHDRIAAQIELCDRIASARASLELYNQRMRETEDRIAELRKQADELAKLKGEVDQLETKSQEQQAQAARERQEKVGAVKQRIAALDAQYQDLLKKIAEEKKNVDDARQSVTVQGVADNAKIKPTYIECHKTGLTIFQVANKKLQVRTIDLSVINKENEFAQVVRDVADAARRGDGSVINLLVRTDGVKAYNKAIDVISAKEAPYATIPITVNGRIRFRDSASPGRS